jgi:hypothetical protein
MSIKELKKIRQVGLIGHIKLTHHAIEEMDEDNLEVLDIESAILTGTIVQKQRHQGTTKYRIYGKSTTQEMITVVGRFTESDYFLIITVFRGN